MKKVSLTGLIVVLLSGVVFAHGAPEYLQLDSYDYSEKGVAAFYLRYDYMVPERLDAGFDRWEITPGFSYTIMEGLRLDGHFHFAKFGAAHIEPGEGNKYEPLGPPPFIEAAALGFQYNFVRILPLDLAFAMKYELPFDRAQDLLGADNVIEGTLIMGRDFGNHSNMTLNIISEIEDGDTEMEWGAGIKTPLSRDPHGISGGVEIFSSFDSLQEDISILPGIYMPLGHDEAVVKTGLEFGKKTIKFSTELLYNF